MRHDAPLFGLRDKGGATFELRLADKMGGGGQRAADLILVEVRNGLELLKRFSKSVRSG